MNKFKYIDGELWLDIPKPRVIHFENPKDTDEVYKRKMSEWENRLHYPCSPELKAILNRGQIYELGKDFTLGLTTEGTDNFYNGQLFDIAIPLPEQPPTEEGQQTTVDAHQWLIDEGYPLTMPISRDTLGDIINRYVYYYAKRNQEQKASQGQISEWQLCPKCLGEGHVLTTGGYQTAVTEQCDVCNGAKALAKPIITKI